MNAFVDPRANPDHSAKKSPARRTSDSETLTELHRLCREGRIYDVERWIEADQPVQLASKTTVNRRRATSALEIALECQNQALVLLLLCNGYDPNLEADCPLNLALRARRWDLLDLLLESGADPHRVDPSDLFETYRCDQFERFRGLGVDLSAGHALAESLAYHTSNKPLFGFAMRHRQKDPTIQTELNMALAHHAAEGNEKGVQLCLWAGADPHAPTRSLRFPHAETTEGDRFIGFSAVYEACQHGHAETLGRLGPDPSRDDFDELYRAARDGAIIEVLARSALPKEVGSVIQHHLWRITLGLDEWQSVDSLRRLFKVGARWETSAEGLIVGIRRLLLKVSDDRFVDLIKLLAENDYCSSEILKLLARTPSMRARMGRVGFLPRSLDDRNELNRPRPTGSREVLSRFGIEIPKTVKLTNLPRSVQIGLRCSNGRELKLDRMALFERVWSEPVATLAKEWGLSGRGLAKACRRLKVPVPPRGFWAQVVAGHRIRRPRLGQLRPGEAEEIVIWVPD